MERSHETHTTIPADSARRRNAKNTTAGMKWCPQCVTLHPVAAFGIDKLRDDGLTGWCRPCRAEKSRARRAKNPDRARTCVNNRYAANPPRWHANVAVSRAIRSGKLPRPAAGTPCKCGKVSPLEAHHHLGHEKENWLNVEWCCRSCRALADAPKIAQERAARRAAEHLIEESKTTTVVAPLAPRRTVESILG